MPSGRAITTTAPLQALGYGAMHHADVGTTDREHSPPTLHATPQSLSAAPGLTDS